MAVVTLSSPTDNATGVTEPITFSWVAYTGALRYHIQITLSTDTGFASPVIDVMPEGTGVTYQTSVLEAGTSYIWRVRALAELEDLIPVLSLGLSTYDFIDTATGSYTDHEFTLSNTGNASAEDVTVAVTGTGYAKQVDLVSSTIAASAHDHFTVRFSPDAVAEFNNGLITISWPNRDDVTATLTGTGITADPFTTYFSDDFNRADSGNVAGAVWTTETDTASLGAISSNQYVITVSGTNPIVSVAKTGLTAHDDTETSFDFAMSSVTTAIAASKYFTILSFGNNGDVIVRITSDVSGVLNGIYVRYLNGASTWVDSSTTAWTPSAATTYNIKLRVLYSTTTSSNDAVISLLIDNVEKVALTGISTANRSTTGSGSIGFLYAQSGASTCAYTFDNYLLRYK